jgi:hypothetical protein
MGRRLSFGKMPGNRCEMVRPRTTPRIKEAMLIKGKLESLIIGP